MGCNRKEDRAVRHNSMTALFELMRRQAHFRPFVQATQAARALSHLWANLIRPWYAFGVERLEQLRAKQQRIESRRRSLESRRARREDTRRKILVSTVVLAKVERGEMDEKGLKALLDKALSRDDDRRLFDLPTGKERR